jgi:hypothetical protein
MILSSFQREMAKIAAARHRGGLDLSGIHRQNLEDQRDDLLGSEKKWSYVRAGGGGAAAGLSAPLIFQVLPALVDGEALSTKAEKQVLQQSLYKALKENKDLGMTEMPKAKLEGLSHALADQHQALPSALRSPGLGRTFQRIRQEYPSPADTRWQVTKEMGELYHSDFLKKVVPSARTGSPVSLDAKQVDQYADLLNQGQIKNRSEVFPRMLKNNYGIDKKIRSVEDLQRLGAPQFLIDDFKKSTRPIPKDEIFSTANKVQNRIPPHPSAGSASTADMHKLITQIAKRHGKVDTPSGIRAAVDHAGDLLSKAKPALALGAVVGALAGLASVRNKRHRAREIRSSNAQ